MVTKTPARAADRKQRRADRAAVPPLPAPGGRRHRPHRGDLDDRHHQPAADPGGVQQGPVRPGRPEPAPALRAGRASWRWYWLSTAPSASCRPTRPPASGSRSCATSATGSTNTWRRSRFLLHERKTGEIQSRLPNDVGGLQLAVTNTFSLSYLSTSRWRLTAIVAMVLLAWQLALVSMALIPPVFVFMCLGGSDACGVERSPPSTQEVLAEMSVVAEETLSVSRVLLSKKSTAAGRSSATAPESERLARLRRPRADGRSRVHGVLNRRRTFLISHAGLSSTWPQDCWSRHGFER